MVERIKEIILKEGLTSGSFADTIGVQRSSMSHILNGRNNPSLDFIIKTLQNFPKINPEWMLSGVGEMYRGDNAVQPIPAVRERSIFDSVPGPDVKAEIAPEPIEKPAPIPEPAEKPAPTPAPAVKPAPAPEPVQKIVLTPDPKPTEIQKDPVKIQEKYVRKVLIFYSDRTYDEFLRNQNPDI